MNTLKILVVEDEAIVAFDLQRQLLTHGFTVDAVTAYGEEAIKLFEHQHSDLILLDIRLKGTLNGIAVANSIRKQSIVPIVFLTALSDSQTLHDIQGISNSVILKKPFYTHTLFNSIENALQLNIAT